MSKYRMIFIFLGIMLGCFPLSSAPRRKVNQGKANFSKSFQTKWGNRSITVRQEYSNSKIEGDFPSSGIAEKCAKRFYETLDYLPEELIKKTRLKYVTFLRNLKLNGQPAAGIASGGTIFLRVDFSAKTVYHEFFHIFDPQRNDKKWQALNEKDFIYTGSDFYKVDMTAKERRQSKRNKRKSDITKSFVSEYAMSFEHEDRAETFAFMITEGKAFLKRAKNPVIKAKMEYIMELFISRNLLDQSFWDKHFDSKFKVKNRFYQTR